MSAKLSKIIAIVLSVVVIIAAVFTAVSFATSSILTKKLSSQDKFEEAYYKGSYTSDITIDEVDFGIMETVNLFKDINYVLLVTRTQGHEQTLRDYEEKIDEIEKEYTEFVYNYTGDRESDSFKNSCENYAERIESVEKDIEEENKEFKEWRDAKYDAEDFEILAEKLLTDKSFLNSIGTMYFILSIGSDEDEEVGREDYLGITVIDEDKYDLNDIEIITMLSDDAAEYRYNGFALTLFAILGGILIAGLILTIIIALISLTIMIIKAIVKLLIGIKKSDDPKVVFGRNEFTSVGMTTLVFALLAKLIYGAGIEIGGWVTAAVILLIVNSVCSMVINLIANKFNTTLIIKTAISGVSAVLAALLLITVVNFGIANTALNKIYSYGETVFHSRYVEKCSDLLEERDDELSGYIENGQISEYNSAISRLKYDAREYAEEVVKSNDTRVIIIVCINLVLLISAISLFGNVISRFSGAVFIAKSKTVGLEYTESLISPIFAIATCVALCFFTISSVDQLEDSILNSKYSVFVGEYEVEETVDYMLHEQLDESIEDSEEILDDLKDELNEIDDEDDRKTAIARLENVERKLNISKNDLALIEDSSFSSVKAIALAVIVLILEIGHKVLSKILGKKKEEAPVEVAPAEPVAVAEAAPVETPAEEAPVEEAPAEEAPTEEVPAEA